MQNLCNNSGQNNFAIYKHSLGPSGSVDKLGLRHWDLANVSIVIVETVNIISVSLIFMPPTLKNVEGHIAFGLSVCLSVRLLTSEWCMLGI